MGPLGVQEMVVIFLVALVLFGPKKLPDLGAGLGKAIRDFKGAINEEPPKEEKKEEKKEEQPKA